MSLRKMVEITIISASDLPKVGGENSKIQAYAKVSVGEGKVKKTATDEDNNRNPAWNSSMSFAVKESAVKQEGTMLVIKLYCKRSGFRKDQYMGEVHTDLHQLFTRAEMNNMSGSCELPLKKGSETLLSGRLRFSYRFEDITIKIQPSWWKKMLFGTGEQVFEAGVSAVVETGMSAVLDYCFDIGEERAVKETEKKEFKWKGN